MGRIRNIFLTALACVFCVIACCVPSIVGDGPLLAAPAPGELVSFVRGDVNADGRLSQADVISVVIFFQNRGTPPCADAADFDDSGKIEITDLVNLINFFYLRGRYPAEPYLRATPDPTPDELDCAPGTKTSRLAKEMSPWSGDRDIDEGQSDRDRDDGRVIDFLEFFSRNVEGYPGQSGIRVPFWLSNEAELEGFTLSVKADPAKVRLEAIEITPLALGGLEYEMIHEYRRRRMDGYLATSIFMDSFFPYEGNKIPVGWRSVVGSLVFGLSPSVRPGETVRIEFADIPRGTDLRPTPINEFCYEGRSIRPDLGPALQIEVTSQSELFLRGDPNHDHQLNISDVVVILNHLFQGETLRCLDPADANDSGWVDISDVVALASYLYRSGPHLPDPFLNPGRDPSVDDLGDCSSSE